MVDFPKYDKQLVLLLNQCHLRRVLCNDFIFSFEIAMIVLSLCSIRSGRFGILRYQELVVYSTSFLILYQDFIFLSNTYVSFKRSFTLSKKNSNLNGLMIILQATYSKESGTEIGIC